MMEIQLDSVKKHRNASEWRWIGRARCQGVEVTGDGRNIDALCRKLIEAGHTGDVEVKRGDMLVFSAMPLDTWANGKALTGEQPEHLRTKNT